MRGWCDAVQALSVLFSDVRPTEGMICLVCKVCAQHTFDIQVLPGCWTISCCVLWLSVLMVYFLRMSMLAKHKPQAAFACCQLS